MDFLLKFRRRKYVFIGDTTQMLHHVRLLPNDCDEMMFLWRLNEKLSVYFYHMNAHLLFKIDSPSCPNWALRETVLDNCEKSNVH